MPTPDPSLSPLPPLVLYSRSGCCLCEGLEERLQSLPLADLQVVDVDGDPALQGRYGLEVPVLALRTPAGLRDLPRVPPRLVEVRLHRWLESQIASLGG